MNLKKLKIAHKIFLLNIIFLVSFVIAGFFFFRILNLLKVNGPIYYSIVQGKDLIADILPPPAYLIESYLLVLELMDLKDSQKREEIIEKSKGLRAEYEARHEFWKKDLPEGQLRQWMLEKSYYPAKDFFELRDHFFIPAILKGDMEKAREILKQMKEKYEIHRLAIDEVVKMATVRNQADEERAREENIAGIRLLVGFLVLMTVIMLLVGFFIYRNITVSLKQIIIKTKALNQRGGDLTQVIQISSRDEVFTLAEAFNEFLVKLRQMIQNIKKQNHAVLDFSLELSSNSHQSATANQKVSVSIKSIGYNTEQQKKKLADSNQVMLNILQHLKINSDTLQDMAMLSQNSLASIESITKQIENTAIIARQADQTANELSQASNEGINTVNALVSAVLENAKNTQNIQEMVNFIMDIAAQTNLLAMNASIEAAHAGSYGKGFSVVAEEIRKLADKSSKSALEIKKAGKKMLENNEKNMVFTEKTKNVFMHFINEMELLKQKNHEIKTAIDSQLQSNLMILETFSKLNQYAKQINLDISEQVTQGKTTENNIEEISRLTEEINLSIEEESKAIEENTIISEKINEIASNIKKAIEDIEKDLSGFTT